MKLRFRSPKSLRPTPPRPGRNGPNGPDGKPVAEPGVKEHAAEAGASTVGWLDERTGLSPFLRGFLYRKVPKGTNWYYTLGSATLFAFVNQAVPPLSRSCRPVM